MGVLVYSALGRVLVSQGFQCVPVVISSWLGEQPEHEQKKTSEPFPAWSWRGASAFSRFFVAPRPFISWRRSCAIAPSVRDISAQCSDPMLHFERMQLTIESAAAREEVAISARAGPDAREHSGYPCFSGRPTRGDGHAMLCPV